MTDQPTEPADQPARDQLPVLELRPALEAVLLVADQPLDAATLAAAVAHPMPDVESALAELAAAYDDEGRGFELRQVGGGWRYFTREEYADAVERFVLDGQQARLTQAALETLAVVAYRQPVSRGRVSAIRGVNVDGVMRTLLTRGLVEEAGTEPVSGRGALPHQRLLPGADGSGEPRRAARARPLPAARRRGRRAGRHRCPNLSRPATTARCGCRSCWLSRASRAGASARS